MGGSQGPLLSLVAAWGPTHILEEGCRQELLSARPSAGALDASLRSIEAIASLLPAQQTVAQKLRGNACIPVSSIQGHTTILKLLAGRHSCHSAVGPWAQAQSRTPARKSPLLHVCTSAPSEPSWQMADGSSEQHASPADCPLRSSSVRYQPSTVLLNRQGCLLHSMLPWWQCQTACGL